jgi:pyruvate/2-oxoglutarate/acetoin dehydrogenase E1 component
MGALRFRQAIVAALEDEMAEDDSVIVFGEDVAVAGGPFKTSEGLLEKFGPLRVRDTPISEMGFIGAAVGSAIAGMRPVAEIMFMEFLGVALDQLVTEAAKMRYLSNGRVTVPLVVRATIGSGNGFGAQHSQTLENWVTATPGLVVATASSPQNAYGLLRSAIRCNDPVILLEPRYLHPVRGEVVRGEEGIVPLGVARIARAGERATVVTMGSTVSETVDAATRADLDIEIIDLQTLAPWDRTTVFDSVRRTGRLVVAEEAPESGGWGSEIVAAVSRELWSSLRSAPFRITAPDVPVPYAASLETRFLPRADEIAHQLVEYLESGIPPQPWWTREGGLV